MELFAVAIGFHKRSTRALVRALGPIAAGHALPVARDRSGRHPVADGFDRAGSSPPPAACCWWVRHVATAFEGALQMRLNAWQLASWVIPDEHCARCRAAAATSSGGG